MVNRDDVVYLKFFFFFNGKITKEPLMTFIFVFNVSNTFHFYRTQIKNKKMLEQVGEYTSIIHLAYSVV